MQYAKWVTQELIDIYSEQKKDVLEDESNIDTIHKDIIPLMDKLLASQRMSTVWGSLAKFPISSNVTFPDHDTKVENAYRILFFSLHPNKRYIPKHLMMTASERDELADSILKKTKECSATMTMSGRIASNKNQTTVDQYTSSP